MSEYERCICPDMRNFRPAERMEGVVRRIYGRRETEQLVVLLAGKSFKVREAGEKVIEFIWESKELVSSIASVEPHAALAFSGVVQIFPVRHIFSAYLAQLYDRAYAQDSVNFQSVLTETFRLIAFTQPERAE